MTRRSIRFVAALAVFAGSALAQGAYTINIPGIGDIPAFLGTNAQGQPVVFINEVEQAGWTWEKKDTDGDGVKDDIRVKDNGTGVTDIKNGAQGSGSSSGTVHDGNVAYPNNQIGTWSR